MARINIYVNNEKFDRRLLFLGSSTGIVCCNLFSFLLIYLHNVGYQLPHYSWLILGSVCTYGFFLAIQSPAGFTLKGELLPFSVRAIGSSLCATGQSLSTFCVAKMFIPISDSLGMEMNFLLYLVASLVGTVVYYFVLPETRVLSLQFLIGIGYGWTAPTLAKFRDFNITAEQTSWLASINELGKFCGPFIAPWFTDHFGRRYTLCLANIIYFATWSSTIFARNFYILCITRVMFGLANSINDVADCAYITENSSPTYRGVIGSVMVVTYFTGTFVENTIAAYLSYTSTAVVNTLMAGCVFISLPFCTETPYFLVMKGRREEAKKNLTWLSGDASRAEIANELYRIERSIEEEKEKKKSLKLLFSSPANMRGILLVVSMSMFGMACGNGAITPYASYIFSPTQTLTANDFTVMYGFTVWISVAIAPFVIEKFNRRSLFLGSSTGIVCCNLCSFLLIYLHNVGYQLPHYSWLIFGSVCTYGFFLAIQSPAGFTLKGELLPFSVRAIGSSLCATGQSLSTFCVAKMFIPISDSLGMEMNFLLYLVASSVGTVVYYFVLPETRGKTLHELQNLHKREHRGQYDIDAEATRETFFLECYQEKK